MGSGANCARLNSGCGGRKARGVFYLDANLSLVRGDARARGKGLNRESNRGSCTANGQPAETAMYGVNQLLLFGAKILLGDVLQSIPLYVVAIS
jgi:hypothetical protein